MKITKNPLALFTGLFLIGILSCTVAESGKKEPAMNRTIPDVTAAVTAGATDDGEKLKRIYLFVRDEIEFNWKYPQDIPADEVLNNGFGVCMQKANLLSAMAREAGFETRFRFLYVRKQALEDFLPDYAYKNWMDPFPHTVVEIRYQGEWISFDPSFDKELYDICMEKGINFARYPEIRDFYTNEFSLKGMKGTQEYWEDKSLPCFYGEDLSPLIEWDKKNVPAIKRALKPGIFKDAKKIMDKIRK